MKSEYWLHAILKDVRRHKEAQDYAANKSLTIADFIDRIHVLEDAADELKLALRAELNNTNPEIDPTGILEKYSISWEEFYKQKLNK